MHQQHNETESVVCIIPRFKLCLSNHSISNIPTGQCAIERETLTRFHFRNIILLLTINEALKWCTIFQRKLDISVAIPLTFHRKWLVDALENIPISVFSNLLSFFSCSEKFEMLFRLGLVHSSISPLGGSSLLNAV